MVSDVKVSVADPMRKMLLMRTSEVWYFNFVNLLNCDLIVIHLQEVMVQRNVVHRADVIKTNL